MADKRFDMVRSEILRSKVFGIASEHGLANVSNDTLGCLALATESRLRSIAESLSAISARRTGVFKSRFKVTVTNDVRKGLFQKQKLDREREEAKNVEEMQRLLGEAQTKGGKKKKRKVDPEDEALVEHQRKVDEALRNEEEREKERHQKATIVDMFGDRRAERKRRKAESTGEGMGARAGVAGSEKGAIHNGSIEGAPQARKVGGTEHLTALLSQEKARKVTARDAIDFLRREPQIQGGSERLLSNVLSKQLLSAV